MNDLEGHCAGEQGCVPFPNVAENIVTHEEADRQFDKAVYGFFGYYINKIKTFFKKSYECRD